jgi:propanol-preferring alcohol dehydrogenase
MLPTTMRAARLHKYGSPLQVDEVPVPRPEAGEVLVRVQGAGFCHSDLHVISGEIPILPRMPLTLGHENAGVVAAVGAGVRSVKEGDPVAVYGAWGDGLCDYCVAGEENLCPQAAWVGLSDHEGGYAEFLLVPHERYLVKLGKLDPKVAAPLTDAALTPYRAVKAGLRHVTPDYPVLVIGAGGLGQFGIKLLRALSESRIIVADLAPEKLETARRLGAHETVNSGEPGALEKVRDLAPGGVAAAFDFVGVDPTLELAFGAARRKGCVVQVGLGGGTAKLTALKNWQPEVAYWVSYWGNIKELREVLDMAEDGRLTPTPLEYEPLDHVNDVYERLKKGEVEGRAVITP